MLGRGLTLAALVAVAACSAGGGDGATPTTTATVRLGTGAPPPAVLTTVPTAGEVSTVAVLDGRLFAVGGQLVDGPGGRYARELRELDPVTGEIVRLLEVDGPISRVAAGLGRLWVFGGGDGAEPDGYLAVVDPATFEVVASYDERPFGPYDIDFDGTDAWVSSAFARQLVRFDADGGVAGRLELPGRPGEVVVAAGGVFTRLDGETLVRVDRTTYEATSEPWLGGALLGDAGDGWFWTNEDGDLAARRGEKTRDHVRDLDPLAIAPGGGGGLVVGGDRVLGAVSADGAPDVVVHGAAEVWSVAVVDGVVWGATLGADLLRLGPPGPPPEATPTFSVDQPRTAAGAVVTVRGRGLEPSDAARPLRFVRTGAKPRKVGEATVRPSGSFAFGVLVDPDLPHGRYHVAFDQRRAGDVEVAPARLEVPYRVLVDDGCVRFDGRTWPVAEPAAAGGLLTLSAPDAGELDWGGGTAAVAPGRCG